MPAYSNAKTHVPELFKQIVENDAAYAAIKASPVIDFKEARRRLNIKRDSIRAAEVALKWNTDKGALG